MMLLLAVMLTIPPSRPPTESATLTQPIPQPTSLTLYNEKGEQVAKCDIVDDGQRITGCKIQPDFTLDDLMTAWADALKAVQRAMQDVKP